LTTAWTASLASSDFPTPLLGTTRHRRLADGVAELEERTPVLVGRARSVGAVGKQFTVGDIAAAVWALRGIFQSDDPAADAAWRRHVAFLLAGFRAGR
jgi:hypothetical protein